jgi:hypothetical protein
MPASFVDLNNGTILMNGTGTDIWNAGDQCRFAYKQLNGDGSIIVKVESVDNTDTASPGWSKAGVMIRPTTDTGAAEASNVLSAAQGVSFQYRPTSGAATANTAAAPTTMRAPWWVKLTRTGDVFTAAQSADGVTWTDITPATAGASTVVMPKSVLIGLTVTSHMANVVCGARFSNITTTGAVTGSWTLADVGIAQLAGNGLDTLYVAIEDSVAHRAVVNADPYTIVGGSWQQWKIPLSALSSAGVKLNSIKKMTIGVGDKTKAASGAKGTLYIDDIQFGHPGQ